MKTVHFLLFLLATNVTFAQFEGRDKKQVDSLLQLARTSKDQLILSKSNLQLSEWYSIVSIDSVLSYSNISKKYAQKALKRVTNADRKKEFERVVAGADNNIAYSYFNKGDFTQALLFNKLALDQWKKLHENEGMVRSLNNIGAIYRQLEDYSKALNFYNEALSINLKEGDAATIAITYNNLGSIYKLLDQDNKSMGAYQKSMFYRRKAKDKRGEANTLNNIGSLYKKKGIIDSASFYFNQSYDLIQEVGDPIGIAHASSNLGDIALERNDFATAEKLGKEALKIGQESQMLMIIEQSSGLLKRVYEKTGQWQKAFEMQQLHLETSIKIKSEEAKRSAITLGLQYDYEKQKEIDRIENEKKLAISRKEQIVQQITIVFVIGVSIFVLVLLIILFERYRKVNEQKKFIERQNNERKILLQEIHHRVKNNFQIISSLLKLQSHQENNPQLQKSFQDAINRIHSMASVHEIIYKQDSLAKVDMNVYLNNLMEQLKRSLDRDDIQIDLKVGEEFLDVDQTIPLGIIVNELVTNSFKHAFNSEIKAPKIEVKFAYYSGQFNLEYADNGVGFTPSENKHSLGLELIDTLAEQIGGKISYQEKEGWNSWMKISF
ncbi:MAG: tetratricopeptide repeat protein [Bacteroidota bacterium]